MDSITRVDFDDPDHFAQWQTYLASRDDTHCTDLGPWRRLFPPALRDRELLLPLRPR